MLLSFWTLFSLLGLTLASPLPIQDLGNRELESRNTPLNTFLALLLEYIPAIDGTINAVAGVLTVFEALLADLTGEKTTYNELGTKACTAYTKCRHSCRTTTLPGLGITRRVFGSHNPRRE